MDYHGQHKHSVPAYVPSSNFERQQPTRTTHSSPASLNHEQWLRHYKETVREYGPPRNGQPSLFLFGRDEFERSEIIENGPQNNLAATPVNTPLYPNRLHDEMEHGFSAPGSLHHHKEHEHKPSSPKNSWPYALSSEGEEQRVPNAYSTLTKPRYATLPKQLDLASKDEPIWSNKKSSDPTLAQKKSQSPSLVDWPAERRRESGSWPAITPKMRYIYAYPEEVPSWIQQYESQKLPEHRPKSPHHSLSPPIEKPRTKERKSEMPQKLFESPAPEHNAHRNMIAELKAKFQTLSSDEEPEVPQKPMHIPKEHRHSPQHVPADPPPIPPAHKNLPPKQQSVPKNSMNDLYQVLQTNDSHVLPVVDRFLKSNFGPDPHKTLDLTQFRESEVPLQHYWERTFRVSDGQKNAVIKIENLLTIENGVTSMPSSTQSSPLLNGRNRIKVKPESPFSMSAEDSSSWQKTRAPGVSDNSYATVMSSNVTAPNTTVKQPSKLPSLRTESDLLAIVHRKIAKGIPLEWPELFLLKNSHCRWVVGREKEYRRLGNDLPKTERAWRQISTELTDAYLQYQEILERVRPIDDLYTDLAHSIMKAESFWYGARVCADHSLRTSWYRASVHLYKQLLSKARECLPPNDRSLLTILDKLSMIMLESCQADPVTVQLCRTTIGAAEQSLDMEINLKIERKLIKIKNNLLRIESNILH